VPLPPHHTESEILLEKARRLEREAVALEPTIASLTEALAALQLQRVRLLYDAAIAMDEAAEARARKYPARAGELQTGREQAWASLQLVEACKLLSLPPGGFTAPIAA